MENEGQPGARRILLVEDTRNLIFSIQMCLEREGFDVRIATDGVTAINFACEDCPDLILLDIRIPKLNGYLVCEALKADERTRGIPVVVISALAQQQNIKRAMDLGVVGYLVKPFQPRELVETVKRVMMAKRD
jgi:CheY-like chemotaxis protein